MGKNENNTMGPFFPLYKMWHYIYVVLIILFSLITRITTDEHKTKTIARASNSATASNDVIIISSLVSVLLYRHYALYDDSTIDEAMQSKLNELCPTALL